MFGFLCPLLFVGNPIEIARAASPREFRHLVHTLPVDRGRWAVAKLVSAFVCVGLVPFLLIIAGVVMKLSLAGKPVHFSAQLLFIVPMLCTLSAFTAWTMVWAAVLPHRWVLVAIPVFVGGEALARNVYSIADLGTAIPLTGWARGLDFGLLALLAALLAGVFVVYHKRRQRGWSLLAAFLVLGGIDGARAVLRWLMQAN